jgi:hypothetical protein
MTENLMREMALFDIGKNIQHFTHHQELSKKQNLSRFISYFDKSTSSEGLKVSARLLFF